MTNLEFKDCIKKLIGFYGPAKYPDEIALGIWKELGDLDQEILLTQIDSFIQESNQTQKPKAPTLEKFKTALFSQLNDVRRKNNEDLKKKFGECEHCHGVGAVSFYPRDVKGGASCSFQCDCPLGEKLYPCFPKQHFGMQTKYMTQEEHWGN